MQEDEEAGADDDPMVHRMSMPQLPTAVEGLAHASSPPPPPPLVAQPDALPQADAAGAKCSEAEKRFVDLLKRSATPAQKQQLSGVLHELQARAPSFVRSGFRSARIRRPGGHPLSMSARFSRAVTPRVCRAR